MFLQSPAGASGGRGSPSLKGFDDDDLSTAAGTRFNTPMSNATGLFNTPMSGASGSRGSNLDVDPGVGSPSSSKSGLDSPKSTKSLPGTGERSSSSLSYEDRKRQALERDNPGDDLHLDADFDAQCRMTVGLQRAKAAALAQSAPKGLGGTAVHSLESVTASTSSTARLQRFLQGDGAAYTQYDLSQPTYVGGALPSGWVAVRSRTTGRMFYANQETGETQWDPPLYPLSRDWTLEHSPSTGAIFYQHKWNNEWRWDRPADELFLNLKNTLGSDTEALKVWKERNEDADCAYGGLDELRARSQVPALPPIDAEPRRALPAPS